MGSWRPRNLAECFSIIWRRKLLIVLFATGAALATLTLVGEIPSTYESQVLLVISEQAAKNSNTLGAQIVAANGQATSASNLASLIERHDLRNTDETMESAVQSLRKAIKIETKLSDFYPQVPQTVTISVRLHDPKLAQETLTDFLSTFEEANETIRKRTEDEANWLVLQIAEVENELAELGLPTALTPDLPRVVDDAKASRLTLFSAIEALDDKQYALEQQIVEQRRQIREQERLVKSEQNTIPKDAAYGVLLVRKVELNAQLAEFARQYTEKNPKVVQVQAQLAEVNQQLAALEAKSQASAATPSARDLLALERDLVRLQTDLEITRRDLARKRATLAKMPETESPTAPAAKDGSEAGRVNREVAARYDRLIRRDNTLLDQRDSIQKSGVLKGDVPPLFKVVDPPNLPQQAVGPNRLLLRGIALALAFGVGLLVAPIAEWRRLVTIQDYRDVEYYLAAPVLGLIPETLTPLERSLKWRRNFAFRVGVLSLAAVAPAAVLVLKHFGMLQGVFQ